MAMARTFSTDEPLLPGHVRVWKDNVGEESVIETTKFNHAVSGLRPA
jgi:hypothetical protein